MPDQCGAITMPIARSTWSAAIRSIASGIVGGECFIPRYARNASPPSAFSRSTIPSAWPPVALGGVRPGRPEQREPVADRGVAAAELVQMFGRRRPAAADVRVVALDVV